MIHARPDYQGRFIDQGARKHTYPLTVQLVVYECPRCGIVYGIPLEFADSRYADGGSYYCPNGHSLSWHETDADRERARADKAEWLAASRLDTANRYKANAEHARRSAIALKGHLTRMRRRIANGVCPVPGCKRSGFEQVLRHIATQHADWLADHPEVTQENTDG